MTGKKIKCEIYNDCFQNRKRYNTPKAQLIIADTPYNIGNNFYGSRRSWWKDDKVENGYSENAGKSAFYSDYSFNLFEFYHFCSRMLKPEDNSPVPRGRSSNSPCMIVFCSFEQMNTLIEAAKKNGFQNYIPLVFVKKSSPQTLKVNMRIVGATEYALVFYRGKLPKFRNGVQVDENGRNIQGTGRMVKNWFEWEKDNKEIPKIHTTQKPIKVIKRLIEVFTDPGDVVIDPVCGSGSTLRAAYELGRNAYGFEINKEFYNREKNEMLDFNNDNQQMDLFSLMNEVNT